MKTVVTTAVVDDAELTELLTARTDPVIERDEGHGVFELEDGPFNHYRRVVQVAGRPDGTHEVTQTTTFDLAIPVWGPLFVPLVKKAVRNPPRPGERLWWLPPDHMDRRATEVLSLLCVYAMIAGYLGVLLSQLNPYFKAEFGLDNTEVANVLVGVRIAGIFALAVVAFADRRGRRTILLFSTNAAILLCLTGALAPGIAWLGVSQTLARTFSAAVGLLVGIMSAEEMPRGARAFAVSMLVAAGALGAGGVVLFLQVAELAPWAWRIFFVTPLLLLVPAIRLGRRLPESRRFEIYELAEQQARGDADAPVDHRDAVLPAADAPVDPSADHLDAILPAAPAPAGSPPRRRDSHGFRFAVLAASSMLMNVFLAPAGGFFNEFLKNERGFNGAKITALQVLTNLPGGISMIVGGRLAESRGRRIIGAIGTAAGFGFTVLMYQVSGLPLWIFSTLGTLIGAIAIPALGVYGAELFPTGQRGLAGGGINLFGVLGGVAGLLVAGVLSDPAHFGSFGPTMAVLGIGPLIVVFLIIAFYPETAHRELEDINPEDAPPPHGDAALGALDEAWEDVHEAHPADHPHEHLPHLRHRDDDHGEEPTGAGAGAGNPGEGPDGDHPGSMPARG